MKRLESNCWNVPRGASSDLLRHGDVSLCAWWKMCCLQQNKNCRNDIFSWDEANLKNDKILKEKIWSDLCFHSFCSHWNQINFKPDWSRSVICSVFLFLFCSHIPDTVRTRYFTCIVLLLNLAGDFLFLQLFKDTTVSSARLRCLIKDQSGWELPPKRQTKRVLRWEMCCDFSGVWSHVGSCLFHHYHLVALQHPSVFMLIT